jgi:hypothetical protein
LRCGVACLCASSLDEVGGRRRCQGQVWEAELCGVSIDPYFERFEGGREVEEHTSLLIVRSSSHISRGRMFLRKGRLMSDSWISSSASRGCRGKEEAWVLQVFMAQVRKWRVRSFIVAVKV